MDESQVRNLLQRLGSGAEPPGDALDQIQRAMRSRRRARAALIAVVVVGLSVGMLIIVPAMRGSDNGSNDVGTGPVVRGSEGPTVERASAQALCGSELTARFAVGASDSDAPGSSPEAAASRWVPTDEIGTVARTKRKDRRLVSVSSQSAAVSEVLTVQNFGDGWFVVETTACMTRATNTKCVERVIFQGHTYKPAKLPDHAGTGVGMFFGQGKITTCVITPSGVGIPRGVVSPVTAFGANEQPASEAIVITKNGHPQVMNPD